MRIYLVHTGGLVLVNPNLFAAGFFVNLNYANSTKVCLEFIISGIFPQPRNINSILYVGHWTHAAKK